MILLETPAMTIGSILPYFTERLVSLGFRTILGEKYPFSSNTK